MAHKKGQGSSRNGRDSQGQRRGITATIPTTHLQLAYGFEHNQLVAGVGVRYITMTVDAPDANGFLFRSSGPGFEFGVCALAHVVAASIVDHRDLVGLTGCICREQVGHGRIRTTCRPTAEIQSPTQTIVCVRISEGRPSEILTQTRS